MSTHKRGQERARAFGVELKLARIRAGTLQAELAERVGVHSTSISQWERGDRSDVPDRDTVELLDAALDANGALLSAAGWATGETSATSTSTSSLPLPQNLTAEDVRAILTIAQRISEARSESVTIA